MKALIKDIVVEDENSDIIHLWEPFKFEINETYKYVPNSILFSICANLLYYLIAYPIIKIITHNFIQIIICLSIYFNFFVNFR